MKVEVEASTSPVTKFGASVRVNRKDGAPIDAMVVDGMAEALNDMVVDFLESCNGEEYFACGSAGLVEARTSEFHPDDRATDKVAQPFPATLESEEEIEAREQEKADKENAFPPPAPVEFRKCKACHATTTQMTANQCPMCGNPFT